MPETARRRIGWALIDDMTHAEVKRRNYHQPPSLSHYKRGEEWRGPHPIKTSSDGYTSPTVAQAVLLGLRYVLPYLYMTSGRSDKDNCRTGWIFAGSDR